MIWGVGSGAGSGIGYRANAAMGVAEVNALVLEHGPVVASGLATNGLFYACMHSNDRSTITLAMSTRCNTEITNVRESPSN